MPQGEFHRPLGPDEVCRLLTQYDGEAHILAGGTDLMAKINRKLISPRRLIYIGDCGLDYIREDGQDLVIGGATRFSEIIRSSLVQAKAPLLAAVVKGIGSPAIRNAATIGGNLSHASPAADSAVALLALGARLKLISEKGQRLVPGEEFFTGPGETVLEPDELLAEIHIPTQLPGARWANYKLGRRRGQTLSVVSVAVHLQMNGDICQGARIALGAVAPVPLLADRAAALLAGNRLDKKLTADAARTAAEQAEPIDDHRASAWYRRRVSEVLVKRLLDQLPV